MRSHRPSKRTDARNDNNISPPVLVRTSGLAFLREIPDQQTSLKQMSHTPRKTLVSSLLSSGPRSRLPSPPLRSPPHASLSSLRRVARADDAPASSPRAPRPVRPRRTAERAAFAFAFAFALVFAFASADGETPRDFARRVFGRRAREEILRARPVSSRERGVRIPPVRRAAVFLASRPRTAAPGRSSTRRPRTPRASARERFRTPFRGVEHLKRRDGPGIRIDARRRARDPTRARGIRRRRRKVHVLVRRASDETLRVRVAVAAVTGSIAFAVAAVACHAGPFERRPRVGRVSPRTSLGKIRVRRRISSRGYALRRRRRSSRRPSPSRRVSRRRRRDSTRESAEASPGEA